MQSYQLRVAKFQFIRFLMSGGANTLVTYFIYLVLLNFLSYQESYTIAYVCGIVLAFFLGRFFVFKSHRGARSIVFFPLIYLAQYLVSMLVLWVWVERLDLGDAVAPLVAIVITVPITYVLSSFVFINSSRIETERESEKGG